MLDTDLVLPTAILQASYAYEGIPMVDESQPVELHQTWNPVFIVFAYMIACVSAYSAVHLLDHSLWRCDELKKIAIIKHPDVYAACMLAFGGVWCMHFVSTVLVISSSFHHNP